MSVRLAVIGAGIMGADHARIIVEDMPGAVLQVICDMDEGRAGQVAETLGAGEVSTDPLAVIARKDVDAIIIASPDATHAPLSRACLDEGKPALCEKPLSQSTEECLSLLRAEMATGRRSIQLGFMRRFDQSYREMRQALRTGVLGRALMMHNFHRNVETPASDFTGAMAITNSAPHEFDVTRHILDAEFVEISAYQPRRSDALVGPVVMVLRTRDDQLVTIEINNNAAYGYDVRGELVGEAGSLSLSAPVHSRLDTCLKQSISYAADWRPRFSEAYRRQDRAFLKFLETGVFPEEAATCWDGYAAACIGEAGVIALETGRPTPIVMVEQPVFYARENCL